MYKKEELKLINMEKIKKIINDSDEVTVFSIEDIYSVDDKIKFIDNLKDGVASYMLKLLSIWEKDRSSLPVTIYKTVKVNSLKAWLRKNDTMDYIDKDEGYYYLFGNRYTLDNKDKCPKTRHGYDLLYTGENIVHQWFHDLLFQLYIDEIKYFKSINPYEIKLKKVKDYGKQYRIIFDNSVLNDIIWNGRADIDEKTLDLCIEAYEQLENNIKTISINLNSKIPNLVD